VSAKLVHFALVELRSISGIVGARRALPLVSGALALTAPTRAVADE
jgi:hypothetical protein